MAYLVRRHHVSERRVCRLLGQHRSTQRYAAIVPGDEARLLTAMNALVVAHPRWGYRTICTLLRNDGWAVNSKRIERLWRLEGHRVPPSKTKQSGRKAQGSGENSSVRRPALGAHHIWSYDFVSARVRRGGSVRILNVVDEYTRLSLGSLVARSIGAGAVVGHLTDLMEQWGTPTAIRSDNGREFIAATVVKWLLERGVEPVFIEKASPQQNPYVERFNGTMRRELLNTEEFRNLLEARVVIGDWVDEYNTVRPHRGLAGKTPTAFATAAKRAAIESSGQTDSGRKERGR